MKKLQQKLKVGIGDKIVYKKAEDLLKKYQEKYYG